MWKNEIRVLRWDLQKNVTLGVDLDGDIGIIDYRDYSIIIHKDESGKIIEWLKKNFQGERISES